MDTDDTEYTWTDVLDELESASGQSYITSVDAFELLVPFAGHVTAEFATEHTHFDPEGDDADPTEEMGALALSGALESTQRSANQARGIVTIEPHRMLVTYSDVSAILVDALGSESSDYQAGGAGFTADGRHDENVETLTNIMAEAAE